MQFDFVHEVLMGYKSLVAAAAPVAFVIAACNIGINIILKAFTNGKLQIGGRG